MLGGSWCGSVACWFSSSGVRTAWMSRLCSAWSDTRVFVFLVCVLQRFTAAAEAESRLQLFTHMLTGMVTLFGFMFSWLVFWCLRSMLPSERMRQKEIAEKKVAGIMVQMKKVTRSGRSFREASEGQRFGGVGGVLLSHFDLCCFLVVLFAARLISTFFSS